jgi:MFS transporter, DHA3 family, tetracycline resistance protein
MRLRADLVWYAYEAVASLLSALAFTVAAYFYVTELHMSPLELVLVGTAMELAIFVFEVPTGVVADMKSRRLSIVIGNAVMSVAFFVVAAATGAWVVIAAYALWGFGYTFTSGAMDAWLADEIGPERLNGVYLRGAQIGRGASVVGIVGSVALATLDVRIPIALASVGFLGLAVFYALCMPEAGFRPLPREERGGFAQMGHTAARAAGVVRGHPVLLAILGISVFSGAWSESYDRLWQAFLIRDVGLPSLGGIDPVVWFGILGVVGVLLAMVVAQPLTRRLEHAGARHLARALFVLDLTLVLGSLVFAFAGAFWVVILGSFTIGIARGIGGPIFAAWLNGSIKESGVRATVISMTNQADAVGQWTGGPALGAVATAYSIRAGLVLGALFMLPALALYRFAARAPVAEPAVETAA